MRLLEEMEEVSAPGSVLLTSMTPISITQQQHAPSSLLSSWVWGFSNDFIEVRSQESLRFVCLCSIACEPESLRGYMQVTAMHGWSVVDCMDYSSIAELYGYEYMKRDKKLGAGNAAKIVPKAEMIPECAQVVVSVLKRDTQ
jgi:hypothetical protein